SPGRTRLVGPFPDRRGHGSQLPGAGAGRGCGSAASGPAAGPRDSLRPMVNRPDPLEGMPPVRRRDPLESRPPVFGEEAAKQILRDSFVLEPSLTPLAGERGQNFRVDTRDGGCCLVLL